MGRTMGFITNDGGEGDGFATSVLPDDLKDNGTPYDLEDDVDVSFVNDDEDGPILEPRRGQNEQSNDQGQSQASGDIDDEDPRIKERVMRERRRAQEAERSSQAQIEQVEKALLQERKSSVRAQLDAFKISLDAVDVRTRTAREALKAARVDGDVNAEEDIKAALDELTNIRRGIETNMAKLPDEAALDRAYNEHVSARRSRVQQPASRSNDDLRPLNEKAGRWAAQNTWMNDPERVSEKAALQAIDQRLVSEGYNPQDDEYFTEMSKRLAKSFPTLSVKLLDGRVLGGAPANRPAARQSSAPPVASARSVAPPSPGTKSKTRVDLDHTDRRMMRQLGIDLSNQNAVKRYAKEKLMRLRSESAGR
jgi:hypothetical protein